VRSERTQSRRAPTPGSTRASAPLPSTSSGVRTMTGAAPTASSALVTLRRLQMPVSMTAMGALIGLGYRLPLVLGSRWAARGSTWVAASIARPRPLKMASATWWGSSP
jgi:hypothetical protein